MVSDEGVRQGAEIYDLVVSGVPPYGKFTVPELHEAIRAEITVASDPVSLDFLSGLSVGVALAKCIDEQKKGRMHNG